MTAPQSGTSQRLGVDGRTCCSSYATAEQLRPPPGAAPRQESEATVVVAAADADAHAAVVERHERRQHEVEPPRVDAVADVRLLMPKKFVPSVRRVSSSANVIAVRVMTGA